MSSRGLSLVQRITLASAVAAAVGGAASALSAGIRARTLVAEHEASVVRAEALELIDEVAEELAGNSDDEEDDDDAALRTPEGALAHELDDVKLKDARAVLRSGGRVVAGDTQLPAMASNTCRIITVQGEAQRACTVQNDAGVLTLAAPMEDEERRYALLAEALWIGVLSGALLGALSSYLLARWAIDPLNALRDRVRSVNVLAPSAQPLAQPAPQPEVEELRSAIASLIERLSSALKHAQVFAAEAAHELRTPLTMISGELELLSGNVQNDDAVALARVRAQVEELTTLVQRLLVLAQPDQLTDELSEVVDMSDVLDAVLGALSGSLRARVHAMCQDDVLVRGDATLLRALLANAIENALKFSRDDVRVTIEAHAGEALLDVTDHGPGLSTADRARVFEPFYRAPSTRAGGAHGHGLGLALIARVAFRHGGQAQFLERDVGAHLRIRLPCWRKRNV